MIDFIGLLQSPFYIGDLGFIYKIGNRFTKIYSGTLKVKAQGTVITGKTDSI